MADEQLKVLREWWITTPDGCVGFIAVQDSLTKEKKLYAGPGNGMNLMIDRERILAWGTKITLKVLKEMLGVLKK